MRPTSLVASAVLATSFLIAPVASLPSPEAGPVSPTVWSLPLAAASASELLTGPVEPVEPAEPAATPGTPEPAAPAGPVGPEVLTVDPQATEPFDLVAVTWAGDATQLAPQVHVRVLEDGSWSAWEELSVMDEGPDAGTEEYERARTGTAPLLASHAEGVEVRLAAPDGEAPEGARVELVDAERAAADASLSQPLPLVSASAHVAAPTIVTRARWGADESLRNGSASYSSTLKAGILHHTASTSSYTATEAAAQVRAIYAYHTESLGWNDIGYNFLVDRFGTVYEGRGGGVDRAVVGAHAGGFNGSTVGVSALGNYEVGAAPAAMVDSIAKVFAWKLDAFGRDPEGTTTLTSAGGGTARYGAGTDVTVRTILGHRDVGLTACPGKNLYPALASIRSKAAAYVALSGASHNPVGAVERSGSLMGGVQVAGRVSDPDTSQPVAVHAYVNGAWGGAWTSDVPRADGSFGFDLSLPTGADAQRVCVYAINQGAGTANPLLGCVTQAKQTGNPFGNLERVLAGPGGARLGGWVMDPDSFDAVSTHVYVDGRWTRAVAAGGSRPDVGRAYPLMGAFHGIDVTIAMAPGVHEVCLYAINVGGGTTNPLLGCKSVTVLSGNPIGNVEGLRSAVPGSMVLEGWTLDPDLFGAIPVHVYVDGRWGGAHTASRSRPDVRASYPGYSDQRGFSLTIAASRGGHTVCVYAINSGAGTTNPLLGCRSVTVG